MRTTAIIAASLFMIAPAAVAAPALQAAPAPQAAASGQAVTDAQLESFATAMAKVREVSAAVQGGTPTAEQQAAMAAAIEGAGLEVAQFNAISAQVSADPLMQARVAVASAPEPAAGSVAAGVSDAEVQQFSTAMVQMRAVAPQPGAQPTTEQQAAMAQVVESSGLEIDRFNAIATAVSADAHLRARVQLADASREAPARKP